jgi:hypothetical protein
MNSRNAKWLGCNHCHTMSKSFLNDQLRGKVKLILNSLYKKNPKRFKEYFEMFISTDEINHLIDTFHALFGFCYDPLAGYGHYYPYSKLILLNLAFGFYFKFFSF